MTASRSAVAILVRPSGDDLEILMLQRARHEGDPWSGHMAFPGGRQDPEDADEMVTAMRECVEETGIQLSARDTLGRLSDLVTRTHSNKGVMVVTPYVFWCPGHVTVRHSHETVSDIWIPLSTFARVNREQMRWWLNRWFSVRVPCYHFHEYRIWGLSLMMIDELRRCLVEKKRRYPSLLERMTLRLRSGKD
jgi:8-oxo-dGTP pyrophosphatase MutT (NUDIX family)